MIAALPTVTLVALASVAGLIVGSFIAALVHRWPRGESVMTGRSRCAACGRTLTAAELVPLVSYLVQRGRCRRCGAKIGLDAPATELLAAGVGALAFAMLEPELAIVGAPLGWLLLTIALLDLRHFWLPDRLTALVAVLGLGVGFAGLGVDIINRALGGAAGFLALRLIARVYRSIRGRDGMGGGDPKLFGAVGCWVGWTGLPAALLIASLAAFAGLAIGAALGRRVDGQTAIPLGTALAFGGFATFLGQARIDMVHLASGPVVL